MVPAGNKALHLSSIKHYPKTVHHRHRKYTWPKSTFKQWITLTVITKIPGCCTWHQVNIWWTPENITFSKALGLFQNYNICHQDRTNYNIQSFCQTPSWLWWFSLWSYMSIHRKLESLQYNACLAMKVVFQVHQYLQSNYEQEMSSCTR